jgi:hypothetical protein
LILRDAVLRYSSVPIALSFTNTGKTGLIVVA